MPGFREPERGDVVVFSVAQTQDRMARYYPADERPDLPRTDFVKRIAKVTDVDELIAGVYAHLTAAFEETPAETSFGGHSTKNSLPAIPSVASICDEYGAAYGIDPQDVADIDLRIVFQCCRAQRIRNGAKYAEPKRLRAVKSEFLKAHG